MKPDTTQHQLEARMTKIRNGFRGIQDPATLFAFAEGKFLSEEVSTRLQRGIDAFGRERQAAAELKLATEERKRMMPRLSALCDEAVLVARHHYGADEGKMATFGVEKHATTKAKSRRGKAKVCDGEEKQHPHMLEARCGGATLVEEVVTTVVEEVVLPPANERHGSSKGALRSSKRSHSKR